MSTKEEVKKYFMQVSYDDEKFAKEMTEELYSYVKKETPKSGDILLILFGSDLQRIAQKTSTYLTKYFLLEDINAFEMEVSVANGEITNINVDAPRNKYPASI